MNPFRSILRLSIGDLLAKIFSFLAFVYLARVLGVEDYGTLEFARALLVYVLIFGDLGPDRLDGGAGNDVLNGGKQAPDDETFPNGPDDIFDGGPGNDHIYADQHDKDNLIDCGPGRHDVALIDKSDPKPKHCERVRIRT